MPIFWLLCLALFRYYPRSMALKPVLPGNVVAVSSGGGGGSSVSDPGVAWFSATGNTTTGDGTPGNPYGPTNGQKAFDAGFRSFRIGAGCAVSSFTFATTIEFCVFGAGVGAVLQGMTCSGSGQSCFLSLCGEIELTNLDLSGPAGTSISPDGSLGNNLNLYICGAALIINLSVSGGNAYDSGSTQFGGNAGILFALGGGQIANAPNTSGGSGINGGTDGVPTIPEYHGVVVANTFLAT
jgi:hypothetical protein